MVSYVPNFVLNLCELLAPRMRDSYCSLTCDCRVTGLRNAAATALAIPIEQHGARCELLRMSTIEMRQLRRLEKIGPNPVADSV